MNQRKRFFPWHSLSIAAVFVSLVGLLVAYGVLRREAAVEERRRELLADIAGRQDALAAALASLQGAQAAIEAERVAELAASFVPIEGARTLQVDASGGELAREHPRAWADVAAGAARITGKAASVEGDGAALVARPLGEGWLVTLVPEASIEAVLEPLRQKFDALIAAFAATSLAAMAALGFLLRMRLWAFRAQETEQYVIAIRREGAKWKALTESAADMILILDPRDGTILERNRMALASIGERSLRECLPEPEYAALCSAMEQAIAVPGQPVSLQDLHLRTADGREHLVDPLLAGIDLDDDRVVEMSLRDVTRERALERQLAISDRLSSLGLLTAGVAHEINNPLEGIGNYLTLLERGEVQGERRTRYLEQVRHGFDRIRDLVRDLLSFARPGVDRGEADIAQVIGRVHKLVRYSKVFGNVEVSVQGPPGPLVVAGDEARLEQVLLNLLINAATAMGGRGKILIRLRVLERGGEPALELCVDDEGPGIPEENLSRIFDPFFTTTQGTGLGLAISYGIVRAHGGSLSASNRPEGGARLLLELPLVRAPQTVR